MKNVRSYVAIGDSLSEGLGDFEFGEKRINAGWTDRLAALLAQEQRAGGAHFEYANLAIRGTKLQKIMTQQVEAAIRLQPDLVTIMAGSNNISNHSKHLDELVAIFRQGIELLLAAGCQVVVATPINPRHLKVFTPIYRRATVLSEALREICAEYGIPVIDVHQIEKLNHLGYWAEDMVHFSGHGHILVANEAAKTLGLSHRIPELESSLIEAPLRNFFATLRWIKVYVIPFIGRKIRGVTSGDGLEPKLPVLVEQKGPWFETYSLERANELELAA